ncbi:glycosyltransferase family 2 protein [uncultured Bosea sp.]|uniref:glycosyltransferase family 2 protein n=1 Tax=uncultured Bosea sp. TaxID=211457 RepID=UPI0025CEFA00|nr:glycosyltransferase family 2 protein [uncultured Bosea sp.]
MADKINPLVSVVTPVYNGAKFLRECIESVLSQTYPNFEYIILNNASTDETLAIAEEYRQRDSRVRVFSNDELLPIIANHNKAFGLISSESKYCKVVSADDWIYPECLERMVGLAEAHPSIGIVGAYQLSGGNDIWYVRNVGLSYSQSVISGHDICRAHLLGFQRVLGNPTSVMYRADAIRNTSNFFPNPTHEADTSACLEHLRYSDFGFVHQILSHERVHYNRVTTISLDNNAYVSSELGDCQEYGDWYLSQAEKEGRINQLLDQYYRYLSSSALKFKNKDFWKYHTDRLNELGYRFDKLKFSKSISAKLIDLLLNPKWAIRAAINRVHTHSMLRGMQAPPKS